ncbi:hypothetical protein [Aureivirga sp. CE67]|uniref:hypothetical protein n=1 Tax=Aureivirga sp. CE67 TaxID=1788983 RepID=UPI0018C9A654|nr:hypothetical protein [Aureivirga sp. CE67]
MAKKKLQNINSLIPTNIQGESKAEEKIVKKPILETPKEDKPKIVTPPQKEEEDSLEALKTKLEEDLRKKLQKEYEDKLRSQEIEENKRIWTEDEKILLEIIPEEQLISGKNRKPLQCYTEIHDILKFYQFKTNGSLIKFTSTAIFEKLKREGYLEEFKEYQKRTAKFKK